MKDFLIEEMSESSRRSVLILDILKREGPLSRMDLSRILKINAVSISNYVDKLVERGLIYERSLDDSSGGRRPILLDINKEAVYSLGIVTNHQVSLGVVLNLAGEVVYSYKKDNIASSTNEVIEHLRDISENLIEKISRFKDKVKGLGVAIGGLVDRKKEIICWPQGLENGFYSYISMPLKSYLEERFNIPVFVGNDASLACLAEYKYSLGVEVRNVLYMFSGVGCGLIIEREPYTGSNGFAGELFINNTKNEFTTYLGDFSFFKPWPVDLGLIKKAREIVGEKTTEKISSLEDVWSLAYKYPSLKNLVNEAVKSLGIKIAFLVNIFNPEVVIIGGGMEKGGFEFIEKICFYIKEYAFEESSKDLKVMASTLGEKAAAIGAASVILRKVFTFA